MQKKLSIDQKVDIQLKFKSNKKVIETILRQFTFKQQLSILQNLKVLISCIENVLQIQTLSDFLRYLSCEQHIPIQVNIKCLKLQELQGLFDDWVNSKQELSFDLQRVYSFNIKSQLLRNILIRQKGYIDDYFNIISNKKKARGCDIYPLLVELFSNYQVYQYHSDIQSFFQKTTAYSTFQKLTQNYITNQQRIITIDKSIKQDQKYIRRYQFEKLIQYWQLQNPQLQIWQEKRNSKQQIGIITNHVNMIDVELQTDIYNQQYQQSQNSLDLINKTLAVLNKLVTKQNNPVALESFQRLYSCLRNQKIVLTYLQNSEGINIKNSQNICSKKKVNSSFKQKQQKNLSPSLLTKKNNLLSPVKRQQTPQFKTNKLIKNIYKHLGKRKNFNLNNLQIFLYEIGLVQIYQNHIIVNLIEHNFIQDQNNITYQQFDHIIHSLMKETSTLNNKSLAEYAHSFLQLSPKNINLLNPKIPTTTRKQLNKSRTPQNKNIIRLLSKTTNQLDSQDSQL